MELINKIDKTIMFEKKEIRIVGTCEDPWFVARDICNILSIKDVSTAISKIPDEWKGTQTICTPGGDQNMSIINEPALYKIVMRSTKKIAEKFQNCVCKEILPSIRKTGEFKLQKSLEEKEKQLEEKENEIKKLSKKIGNSEKRRKRKGQFIYIGVNELEKDVFKVGISINLNSRTSSLSTGTTTDFKIKKSWITRFKKEVEDAVKKNFQNERILLRKELYNISIYDEVVSYIDKAVNFFNENDRNPIKEEPVIEKKIKVKEPPAPKLVFIDSNRSEKKKCTKCLLLLPLNEFYYREKGINEKDYNMDNEEDKKQFLNSKYRSNCKKCCFQKQKEFKVELTSNQNIHKRKCNNCENILDNEMYYKNKDETFFDNCKNCHNIINKLETVKQCIECKEIFNLDNFHKHSKNILRNQCKICRNSKLNLQRSDIVVCEFCKKEVKHKNNLKNHQKTKTCLQTRNNNK